MQPADMVSVVEAADSCHRRLFERCERWSTLFLELDRDAEA